MPVDPRAATGFADSEAYERVRPSWRPAVVEAAVRTLDLGSASRVVDLAAGTGKLTRALQPLVGDVVAVEPSPEMRRVLGSTAGVTVLDGEAEAIPLADASVDAVFCGQAFHWFEPARAAREIARILRPRGGLALLWNREVDERRDIRALVAPHREAAGSFPGDDWQAQVEALGLFESFTRTDSEFTRRLSADDYITLIGSWSWIANLDPAEREPLLARIRELAGPSDVELRYRTETLLTRLAVE